MAVFTQIVSGGLSYKEEHKFSGELGALQEAVTALQARLEKKQNE